MSDGKIIIDTKIDSSGAEKGIGNLNSIASKGLKGFTGAITGVGVALGGIGAYALKVGSDFEAGMSKVKAISGATADDMVKLSDKAKEMGATTKFSATESSEALQYMAMAGWKTEQMLNGLPGIMNLAAASGEDLALTSDIVTDAMTAFGMKAEESGHFADVLAQASSNSNTNVAMLGESFKYVAPLAGSLGYKAEDTSIALGLMANAGVKASQSGTSLKTALVNMAKPTSNMQAVMDQYGLSLQNTDGSMKSLKEVMDMLRDKMGGLDEATKASASAQLFGKESLAGMLAVINASPEDYEKLTNAIYNADGASKQMADTMNDNLKGQVVLLKSALEGLGIQIYESVDNPMKDIVKSANDMVAQLSEAFKNGGFEGLTNELGNVFAQIVTGISQQAPLLINASVNVIQSFLQGIKDNLPQIADGAIGIVTSLVTGIIDTLPTLLEVGVQAIRELGNGIAEALPELIPKAIDCILTLVDNMVDNIDMLIDVGIKIIFAIADGLIQSLPTLIGKVPVIINKFWEAFDRNLGKILQAGVKLIIKLGEGIIQSIPLIIANAGEICKAILNTLVHLDLLSVGKSLITKLGTGIKNMGGSIINIAKGIGKNIIDGIKSGLSAGVGALKTKALEIGVVVKNSFKDFFNIHSPSRLMRDLIGKNIIAGISVGMENELHNAINVAKDICSKLNNTFKQELNKDTAQAYIDSIYNVNGDFSVINKEIEQAKKSIEELKNARVNDDLTEEEKKEAQKQLDIAKEYSEKQLEIANEKKDKLIQLSKAVTDALKQQLENEKQLELDKIAEEEKAEEEAYNRKIARIDKVTNRKIENLKREQKALDEEKESENRDEELEKSKDSINVLKTKMANTKSESEKKALALKIQDKEKNMSKKQADWRREDEKARIQEEIDKAQEKANRHKERLKEDFEESKKHLDKKKKNVEEYYKTLLETDNLNAQARYVLLTNSNEQLVQLLNSYAPKWQNAGQSLGDSLINGLNSKRQEMADAVREMTSLRSGSLDGYAKGTNYNTRSGIYHVDEKGFELSTGNNPVAYVSKGAGILNHMQSLNAIKKEVSKQMSVYANKLRNAVFADQMRMGQLALAGVGGYSNSNTTTDNSTHYGSLLHADKIEVRSDNDIEQLANELGVYAKRNKKC
ncbi:phage tail tape measure protein [Clostridium botulinum]|uniref:phage tail tape measure protein n=2 Tax=Clostridium botulinum TaxID=1491 RepID=UPI001C9B371B|nr:phage tail tape measure protein [Clostridium botulinum]MBY6816472.1 phage tail tape measure protein [Clostridium botulinum]MBY6827273.1 phage tail tape measure protein [Clostridium botulinum]MBY6859221.1 phage tail tape measure protein [Clostridium botulinum]MBY7041495.1 phage tail tape measure protein [Clostridium botulinum]